MASSGESPASTAFRTTAFVSHNEFSGGPFDTDYAVNALLVEACTREWSVMSGERPDELERLITTTEAVESLYVLFDAEEPLDDVLLRVARTAASAIPNAAAVTVTELAQPEPRTAACTEEEALRLDAAQYSSGRGPCLEAAQRRVPVRVATNGDDPRWPEFLAATREQGVRASLSVPLILDPTDADSEGELVGSLNIYSRSADAFDPFDEELMRLYTVAASNAITNARRWQESRKTVAQLERALTSRTDIDQAKGVLRALHGDTADEAFQRLVDESQARNVKLVTVARELIESVSKRQRPEVG
jgi:GAF domain-containing protein